MEDQVSQMTSTSDYNESGNKHVNATFHPSINDLRNSNLITSMHKQISSSIQKGAGAVTLPSLTTGLMSPAAVAKVALSSKHNFISSSQHVTTPQQANIVQQLSLLNSRNGGPPQNTSLLIKTTKTNTNGQPTYLAISIPANSTSSGTTGHKPLSIQQFKMKQSELLAAAQEAIKNDEESKSYISGEHQSYASQQQPTSQAMVSSFPYGGSSDSSNPGMYTQHSNLSSYMDAPTHGGGGGGNQSQNQMYQSYQGQGNHPASMGVGVSPQAIGVAQQAQYLQPGQAANQRVPISHTTRASPITVQWLLENYETADGVSLPRSTLYHHYLRHCAENKIDAVNAASFGKLIRSVFLGLKTRRLGTRGNSKYHYYGIRVKPNSPLARLTDDTQVALRAQPSGTKRSATSSSYEDERSARGSSESVPEGEANASSAHAQYLGDHSDGLADSPPMEIVEPLPDKISSEMIIQFGNMYRSHCETLLEVISSLNFDIVESLWQSFYKSPAAVNKTENGPYATTDNNIEKADLISLCKYEPVQTFIKETDYILYQKLVNVLVPDVLRAVPSSLTQAIRNFAKSLENLLIGSMSEMPKEIVNIKVSAVSAFSQTLRRYTSLNHLAQAARAVLQNPQQINQMWADLNKVDFTNVQEQSSWVCQCDEALITKLEHDFKHTLSQQQTLEQWAEWLKSVVSIVLEQHEGKDTYPKNARQFLLNWSFYSSMIIRDLTLRSAASFGSFHLIRLLYDEYMFYLIEHKVAAHTGKSPMSVMAECVGLSALGQQTYNGNLELNEEEEEGDMDDSSNDGTTPLPNPQEQQYQQRPQNINDTRISPMMENYGETMAKRMKQE